MSTYDYWARHSFFGLSDISEKAAVDYLLGGGRNPYPHDVPDLSARVILSALALPGDKEYARTGTRREPGGLVKLYQKQSFQDYLQERLAQSRSYLEVFPDLSLLPIGSFTISLTFTLAVPYLSKDDTALHLLDNPVKKEWVFKLPYVASTQWKGALHAAMLKQLVEWWQDLTKDQKLHRSWQKQFVARRIQLTRLFGTEPENVKYHLTQNCDEKLNTWYKRYLCRFLSDTGFLAGRLYSYPSFFDRLSMEVINPHDRETGAGSLPIYFEAVPSGTRANFILLYTPLDRIGEEEHETHRQVTADMKLIAEGLQALFTVYGFGAKTSSGFGLASDVVENGSLVLNLPGYVFPQAETETGKVQSPEDVFLKYLDESGHSKTDFSGSGDHGLMSNSEYKEKAPPDGGSLSEFKEFRRWYGANGEQWQKSLKEKNSASNYPELSFDRLSQLAEMFRQTGGEA